MTQASPTTVTAAWQFLGSASFNRFEIQQRDLIGAWHVVGMTMESSARQWTGTPVAMSEALPFRVVVFNLAGESAASNEVTITGETPPAPGAGVPLTAPQLDSVQQIGPVGIDVNWTYPTDPTDFHRLEVQQRTNGTWQVVATIMEGTTRKCLRSLALKDSSDG